MPDIVARTDSQGWQSVSQHRFDPRSSFPSTLVGVKGAAPLRWRAELLLVQFAIDVGDIRVTRTASTPASNVAADFRRLADEWFRQTAHLSVTQQAVRHRAYRDIIALGTAAIPYILAELRTRGGQWFDALREIAGVDPAAGVRDYNAAAREWERWAVSRGYIQAP